MNLKNKHILVTGADGFLGSHLVEELLKNGANVTALVMYNSFNSYGWLNNLKNRKLTIIMGDIRDPYFLKNKIKKVEIIYNLAALISVPHSFNAPYSNISNNVLGTVNLLNLAVETKVKKFIQFSSSEIYGSAAKVPLLESFLPNPQSPYAASKVASDAIALSYYYSYSLPVTILRPFNTFGPRQSTRAVIPGIISQLIKNQNKIHLGSLTPTRDFNYTKDTISACVAALNIKVDGQVFNICSNFEISIKELVKCFEKILNKKIFIIRKKDRMRAKKAEVNRLLGSNKKFIKQANWEPKYIGKEGFLNALKETFEWYKTNKDKMQNIDSLFL
jgi:NAD dependent epimerase/dehydratase